MAPLKKNKGKESLTLKRVKGENHYRDAKAASRLKMLNSGKPVYDRDGKIKQAAIFQKGEDETTPGRVQPDRRWFGNTRVISQTALDRFRTNLGARAHDPYSVLLRRNKLPMSLLDDALNPNSQKRPHIVETEPFEDTFGPKAQRKRPRLEVGTFEELGKATEKQESETMEAGPSGAQFEQTHADYIEPIFSKGTSRRIYGELYKVIDSSDVILHILDARDPMGTMCQSILDYIRKEKAHKQVVLIINKCDLVPNWVTARYIQHLTPLYPTIAFHASQNHPFGKGSLIQLLRQFSQLHRDKKQISVGFVGYPNVGKSSVINTLKSGKVCRVAPVPGETKVWQYITLTRRIYLIDCPGVVPTSAHDTNTDTVLKGVIRVEALPVPSDHIPALLERVKPLYLARTYGVEVPESGSFEADSLLDTLARKKGRLLKGGEPDREGVAKILLSDWVRGRIPFFVPPPERPEGLPSTLATEHPIGVTQKLGGLIQKNKFSAEDKIPEGGEQAEEEEASPYAEEEQVSQEEGEDDEELQWEDVYPDDKKPRQAEDETAEASDGDSRATKEARVTTNKRKATNFYSFSNVKNRNRNKKSKPAQDASAQKKRHRK